MQVSNTGNSYSIEDLKARMNSITGLSSIDKAQISSAINRANWYGEDESLIEEGKEKETLINALKSYFGDKANTILSQLGLSGAEGENESKADSAEQNQQKEVQKNNDFVNTDAYKKAIDSIPKDNAVANDVTFKKYSSALEKDYKTMGELAQKLGCSFGSSPETVDTETKLNNFVEWQKYSVLHSRCEINKRSLEQYITQMQNWKDGPANVFKTNAPSQLERATVTINGVPGQHVWKSGTTYYYPDPQGMPGKQVIPKELIN